MLIKRVMVTMAAAAAMLCTSVVAKAGDGYGPQALFQQPTASQQYNWTGLYGGIAGGYGVTTSQLDVPLSCCHNTTPEFLSVKGLSGDGFRGQGRVGFDLKAGNSPVVLGVFGGYGFGKSTFDLDAEGVNLLSASLKPTWHAGARVGVAPGNGHTLLFIGGGYQSFEHTVSIHPAFRGFSDKKTVGGYFGTVGIEHMITKQLSFGLDYTYTKVEKISWETCDDGGSAIISSKPVDHAIMARLTARTNFGN